MAALLQEWLVEDLKIQSPCEQLEKARAMSIAIRHTVKCCHRQGAALTTCCFCRTLQAALFLAKCFIGASCSLISISLKTAKHPKPSLITTGVCRSYWLDQPVCLFATPCVACLPTHSTELQPTLQKLGIQLSKHKVAALTREEKDVSAQLLYRIKSALATMNASIAHSQGMNSSKLAATFGMQTELSKGLIEAQQFRYHF